MKNKMLKENIESLGKVIKNLRYEMIRNRRSTYIMDNERLDENTKNFEKILRNLRDYVTELHDRVSKINAEITGIDDDICALEIIRDYHSKMLREKKPKTSDDNG